MRRIATGLGLLALAACAQSAPPDRTYPVFFNEYSSTLDSAGLVVVTNAAAVAARFPRAQVTVTGYADTVGTPDQIVQLSTRRADAVANLLMQDGVVASRITRAGVGTPPNSQPGVERRRVEIDIDLP